jgi:hypothetical protein
VRKEEEEGEGGGEREGVFSSHTHKVENDAT